MTHTLPHESSVAGRFGPYGGRYVPETLMAALDDLTVLYDEARSEPAFWDEYQRLLREIVGRPSRLSEAPRFSERVGARVLLKREDLNHTGAHKINNTIGQALLALRMGKRRIIAETGAGQHGVATATICARFGLECVVYMGAEDVARQALNVYRMRLLGATVVPVHSGTRTLKDATNEALRDWVTNVPTTHYIIGSVVGPDPFPRMVRDFQSVIGREARAQVLERAERLPSTVVACVGGGSNAMGMFADFLDDAAVELVGVEAAGQGIDSGHHSATLSVGRPGVLHGSLSYLLQDADGQVLPAHSVSAGLDYPGVGPEHSWLRDSGRVRYHAVDDAAALEAFHLFSRLEGIIPALETSHAIAWIAATRERWRPDDLVLLCLSGRGDKDVAHVASQPGGAGVTVPSHTAQLDARVVEELLRALGKGQRALQMYLPNNPVYQRAMEQVADAFAPVWSVTGRLVLDIQEEEILWEETSVFRQTSRGEGLAWQLYQDGVRQLTLLPGVEAEEIVRFLRTLIRARLLPADASDDLLTLLWEEEFVLISYTFVEVLGEGVEFMQESGSRERSTARADGAREEVASARAQPESPSVVDLSDFDATPYFLDDAETRLIRSELEEEYRRDIRSTAIDALLDILEMQREPQVRHEVIALLDDILPAQLATGGFRAVAKILRELRIISARAQGLDESLHRAVLSFEERLSQPDILEQLFRVLEDASKRPADEDVGEVMRELKPGALATLLAHLGRVPDAAVRKVIEPNIEGLARSQPQALAAVLDGGPGDAIAPALALAARLGLTQLVPSVMRHLQDGAEAVRLSAVKALGQFATPTSVAAVEQALEDGERSVRQAALAVLVERRSGGVVRRLEGLLFDGKEHGWERSERRAFFEAYGTLAGEDAVARLQELLEPRGVFRRKEPPEVRACALFALGKVRTLDARLVIDRFTTDKEPVVRSAANSVLRDWM